MGNVKALPVVGEVVTVAEGAAKTVAAGACAATGNPDAADRLIRSAGDAFVEYSDKNCIAANIKMLNAHCQGDDQTVQRLRRTQEAAWLDVCENTPIVGHGIGIGRYATGDKAGGDRCMLNASRSTVLGAATIATGGAGALACGAATVTGGVVYDGIATGCNSAAQGQWAPTGNIAAVDRAAKTGDCLDVFNACAGYGTEFATGALHGTLKARQNRLTEQVTPAAELADRQRPRSVSRTDQYITRAEVPNAGRQIPLDAILRHPVTKSMVKTFESPRDVMKHLANGQRYDFVRLRDGGFRVVSHADAAKIVATLGEDVPVGHTSLVPPGTEVVAAGEIHLNAHGVITNINCQSGHFRFPLEQLTGQVGRAFPLSMITFESPTFTTLFETASKVSTFSCMFNSIIVRSPHAVIVGLTPADQQSRCTHITAWYEGDHVEMMACGSLDLARHVFDRIQDRTKVLIVRGTNQILARFGDANLIQRCLEAVLWEGKLSTRTKAIELIRRLRVFNP